MIRETNTFIPCYIFSDYTASAWRNCLFTEVTNVTDEALVLHIVKTYFEKWPKVQDDESSGSSSKREKAIDCKDNLVNNKAVFYSYAHKVKQARLSKYRVAWDKKLQKLALDKTLEQERQKRKRLRETGLEEDSNPPQEIIDYAADYVHGVFDVDEFLENDAVSPGVAG